MLSMLRRREVQLGLIVVALACAVGFRAPVFLSARGLDSLFTDTAILVMMVLAQMLVILTRGVDLSVAANLALCGMLVARIGQFHPGVPLALLVPCAMFFGLVLGSINGLLIGFLRLPPIVVTLGAMSVFRGSIFVMSGGAWVSSHQMSPAFIDFPLQRLLGLPHLVWLAVGATLLAAYLTVYTRFGRELYAIGNHPVSARYVGIPIARRLFAVYAISGLVAGLCGYLWVARYAVAFTEIANGFELSVIAACVIGGVSIAGGVGTVAGAVLGALFLGVINNALPLLQISPFWESAITGAIILVAVVLNAREGPQPGRRILDAHAASESRPAAAGAEATVEP
ncbi:MAG TPA: ABC transporter permease [Burkholderiaceae bacterium]|nr:ABC transporter permease [Burkholderiaceae bacterium]